MAGSSTGSIAASPPPAVAQAEAATNMDSKPRNKFRFQRLPPFITVITSKISAFIFFLLGPVYTAPGKNGQYNLGNRRLHLE